jgi:hypothetical protein
MDAKRRFCCSIVCAVAVLLLSASAADAAARFASPTGSGSACTSASPCDITTAVNMASTNDDVTIEPGTYAGLVTTLTDSPSKILTIHGQAGAPRPVLDFSSGEGFALSSFGTSLSDVEVDVAGPFGEAIGANGPVTIDRVIGHVLGATSFGCILAGGSTLTNSVCVADGSGPSYGAQIVNAFAVTLRNDTLEAPGGSGSTGGVGLRVVASTGSHSTPTLTNVIARGAQADLLAQTDSSAGSQAVITADHSNYANAQTMNGGGGSTTTITAAGSGTNQTAAPQFANPGIDDFHEVASSPTIGAGFSSPANGMSDLDGNPRQVGGSTDIGAYQFIPAPSCQPANSTTAFGQGTTVQLSCSDILGASVSYAIVGNPAHGSATVNASTGQATYTPAAGYSGPDSFTFSGTSSHGTSPATTVSITVTKAPAPSDSQPKLSPTTFAALSSGPSAIAARAKGGAIISYTDSQAATTTFVVRRPAGEGVLSHGKCVKAKHGAHGKRCTLYKKIGSFRHADKAGKNRFRFTGRIKGRKLKPGSYQLVSAPRNSAGESGASHTNTFTIKH